MKLTDVKLNKETTVISVDNCEYQQKLLVLGFISGCKVCPIQSSDETFLVDIKGCRYMMSKEVVEHINVEE